MAIRYDEKKYTGASDPSLGAGIGKLLGTAISGVMGYKEQRDLKRDKQGFENDYALALEQNPDMSPPQHSVLLNTLAQKWNLEAGPEIMQKRAEFTDYWKTNQTLQEKRLEQERKAREEAAKLAATQSFNKALGKSAYETEVAPAVQTFRQPLPEQNGVVPNYRGQASQEALDAITRGNLVQSAITSAGDKGIETFKAYNTQDINQQKQQFAERKYEDKQLTASQKDADLKRLADLAKDPEKNINEIVAIMARHNVKDSYLQRLLPQKDRDKWTFVKDIEDPTTGKRMGGWYVDGKLQGSLIPLSKQGGININTSQPTNVVKDLEEVFYRSTKDVPFSLARKLAVEEQITQARSVYDTASNADVSTGLFASVSQIVLAALDDLKYNLSPAQKNELLATGNLESALEKIKLANARTLPGSFTEKEKIWFDKSYGSIKDPKEKIKFITREGMRSKNREKLQYNEAVTAMLARRKADNDEGQYNDFFFNLRDADPYEFYDPNAYAATPAGEKKRPFVLGGQVYVLVKNDDGTYAWGMDDGRGE